MNKFLYYLITDRRLYSQSLDEVARRAEEAGVDYFQLREKDLTPAELLTVARSIRPVLSKTKMIINGHLDVAVAAEADGVHLQKDNLPVSEVRKRFPYLLIGYSAHSKEEIEMVQAGGADYAFLSPIFAPRSKTTDLSPLGVEQLAKVVSGVKIPVFALGGICSDHLPALRQAGCAGAAGISFFLKQGEFSSKGMVI